MDDFDSNDWARETGIPMEQDGRFQAFVEQAPIAIAVSQDGKNIYVNSAYLLLFGLQNLTQVIGHSIMDQVALASRVRVSEEFAKNRETSRTGAEFEFSAQRLDGSQFSCIVVLAVAELLKKTGTIAFFVDITTQKKSEKNLMEAQRSYRNLARHLLQAREEERKMIAREIHDELGQFLTALKMELQWVQKRLVSIPSNVSDRVHGVLGLTDQMIDMVHKIATELRPYILDELGLGPAIEWLGEKFKIQNGYTCLLDNTATESMIDGKYSTDLFRVIQEALANISNHSKANRAAVELWEDNHILMIRISDNGLGITKEQSESPGAYGLIGIRERIEGLCGHLSIVGEIGKGTVLTASIPLPLQGSQV